jgi:hypothetical protein
LGLLYYFRSGREAGWFRRVAVPGFWFGLAIVAKASAIVYGPICLLTVELERLVRGAMLAGPTGACVAQRIINFWKQIRPAGRDLVSIGTGGLAVAVVYCGSDFRPHHSFIEWANTLPHGILGSSMVWLAENLCIFSNAFEGIVRQIKHNMHGHGTYLLGQAHPRALWYYFPILLAIKLSLPILVAPIVVAVVRMRALTNWACLTALVLLGFSLTFRVQIGIRLVLPLVSIAIIGLASAIVEAVQAARCQWTGRSIATACGIGLLWMVLASARVWPHGLCYVNELWGGTARGYELVSDSNYDWGQGVPELLAWQRQTRADVEVWYFGRDQRYKQPPLHDLTLRPQDLNGADDVLRLLQSQYLAAGTTMVYGNALETSQRNAAAFLRTCKPVARTTTFLIYDRQTLVEAAEQVAQVTAR